MEYIVEFFNDNIVLATIFVAMIPLFELKVAIPFAMNSQFWTNPLTNWQALFSSLAGGLIITIILALIFKPIYNKIKDKKFFKSIVQFFTGSALEKTNEVESKTENQTDLKKLFVKLGTVLLFVAIPVPGTGVYTGTVLSVFLGLNFWQTITTVTLGNFIAGLIIMFICSIFPSFTTIIICVFVALVFLYLLYRTIVHVMKNKKANNSEK